MSITIINGIKISDQSPSGPAGDLLNENFTAIAARLVNFGTAWRQNVRYGADEIDIVTQQFNTGTLYAYCIGVPSPTAIKQLSLMVSPVSGAFSGTAEVAFGIFVQGAVDPGSLVTNSSGKSAPTGSDATEIVVDLTASPPSIGRAKVWLAFMTKESLKAQVFVSDGRKATSFDLGMLAGTEFVPAVKATGQVDFAGNPTDNQTVTLPEETGGIPANRVFTFKNTPVGTFDVQIGGSAALTRDNFKTKLDALIAATTIGDFLPVSVGPPGSPVVNLSQPIAGSAGNRTITTGGVGNPLIVTGFSNGADAAGGTRGRDSINGVKATQAYGTGDMPSTFPTPTYIGGTDFIPHVMIMPNANGSEVL